MLVELAMQVSQLVTVQGWIIQAPEVVLTLYPVAHEVHVLESVQATQLEIIEQL